MLSFVVPVVTHSHPIVIPEQVYGSKSAQDVNGRPEAGRRPDTPGHRSGREQLSFLNLKLGVKK